MKRSMPMACTRARSPASPAEKGESYAGCVGEAPRGPNTRYTCKHKSTVLSLNRLPWLTVHARQHPHISAPSQQYRSEQVAGTSGWLPTSLQVPRPHVQHLIPLFSACLQSKCPFTVYVLQPSGAASGGSHSVADVCEVSFTFWQLNFSLIVSSISDHRGGASKR